MIREEIRVVEEEKRKNQQKEMEARLPEDWEKEEFSHYAWFVHDTGNKLEMTRDQKRQYYTLIKENTESTSGLWEELKKEFPEADNARLSELYRERVREGLNNTRHMVMDLLNKKQQEKYEKMCKESEWFK
jgi:hypothetical protein